jgi:hypothetical protein
MPSLPILHERQLAADDLRAQGWLDYQEEIELPVQ